MTDRMNVPGNACRDSRRSPSGRAWALALCVAAMTILSIGRLPAQSAPEAAPGTPDQRADALLARMTEDEKFQLVHGAETLSNLLGPRNAAYWVKGISRLGIPDILGADGPVGVGDQVGQATALPSSLASAASWDLDEAYKYGTVIGKELRAYGLNMNLGGNVNLTAREPRDGRTFESAGEDPVLAGRITAAHLRGTQDQYIVAGIKHYAMNDQETARTQANAVIGDAAMRESDLLASEIAFKDSGAQMVMCAYNLVNGTAACGSSHLMNDILKGGFGFPGFVLSDAFATPSSYKAAIAGLDQEQPCGYMFDGEWSGASLEQAISWGWMSQSRLDNMAHRILRGMFASGVFDHPAKVQPIDVKADAAIAQEAEEQGAVLLKNANHQLPLVGAHLKSIAVIGAHADVGVLSGGGSAQVIPVGGPALRLPPECPIYLPGLGGLACKNAFRIYDPSSPLAAIKAAAPKAAVHYNDGTNATSAAALAATSDAAIVFVNQWESEGMDLGDLSFSDNQDALVAAVAAKNSHTVVVVESGGPQLMPWLNHVAAVLEAWYPGQRGGEAIANLLFGKVNPSGKLPMTFPARVADLPRPTIPIPNPPTSTAIFNIDYTIDGFNVGYKWYDKHGIKPLFPFGFGLSYASFTIGSPRVAALTPPSSGFKVSFQVRNTGSVAGAEVAQVYLGFPLAAGEPPRRLVAWKKLMLAPGASQQVTVTVSAGDSSHPLSIWSASAKKWVTPKGDYTVWVGSSSAAADLTEAGILHLGS